VLCCRLLVFVLVALVCGVLTLLLVLMILVELFFNSGVGIVVGILGC